MEKINTPFEKTVAACCIQYYVPLKQLKKEALREDMLLIEKIRRSEKQIKQGKAVKADTAMSDKEIDDLLMD